MTPNNSPNATDDSSEKRGKKLRLLTPEAFAQLLHCLDAEREQAAAKYEQVRQVLETYFTFRNAIDPAALTDETLNRVAYRLAEGQEIIPGHFLPYCYAVARNVWRETLVTSQRLVPLAELPETVAEPVPSAEEVYLELERRLAQEQQLTCLRQCLNKLSPEDRALLQEYHQGQGQEKIRHRQALAARLGITIPSLRNRTCRLRDRMAACIRACSGGA
ncbi:MAG: sigma-70 family RNA polymerase sigma factor [Blastocatellia bacterium]